MSAQPKSPQSSDEPKVVSADGTPLPEPTFEERAQVFWMENKKTILLTCALVLLVLVAKEGVLYYIDQREKAIGAEFAAAGNDAAKLRSFTSAHADHQLTGLAWLALGDAAYKDGKFAEAVAQHERTVAAYPNSAWARYELFFSSVSRDGLDTRKKIKRANKLWDETAPGIFRCNPLYTSQFGATRGKSVGAMLDRLVLHRLTNKPPEDFGERVGSMADAALRLEDYGTAALLYWSSLGTTYQLKGLSFLNDEPVALTKEDVLARYLYCLEKLGVPDWKGEFEGDFTSALARLDSALTAHRRQ